MNLNQKYYFSVNSKLTNKHHWKKANTLFIWYFQFERVNSILLLYSYGWIPISTRNWTIFDMGYLLKSGSICTFSIINMLFFLKVDTFLSDFLPLVSWPFLIGLYFLAQRPMRKLSLKNLHTKKGEMDQSMEIINQLISNLMSLKFHAIKLHSIYI